MQHDLTINGRVIPRDREGFLLDLADWNPEVAETLAREQGIDMTEKHWEIINILRDFHKEHELSPAMRELVRLVKLELGEEKGKSIYLLKLFPGSPAKIAARVAGLPRPTNCL